MRMRLLCLILRMEIISINGVNSLTIPAFGMERFTFLEAICRSLTAL